MFFQYRKKGTALNFREGKPTVYQMKQQTMPAVTYKELVNEISASCGVNTPQTKAVVDALVNRMVHYMSMGFPVRMGEFGTFKPTFTSCVRENVKDVSTADVKRKKIRFYPGEAFREMLKGMQFVQAGSFTDEGDALLDPDNSDNGGQDKGNLSGGSDSDGDGDEL